MVAIASRWRRPKTLAVLKDQARLRSGLFFCVQVLHERGNHHAARLKPRHPLSMYSYVLRGFDDKGSYRWLDADPAGENRARLDIEDIGTLGWTLLTLGIYSFQVQCPQCP